MTHVLGIDVSKDSCMYSVFSASEKTTSEPLMFSNSPDGYKKLQRSLSERGLTPENLIVCLEDTGVYAESLCYWLVAQGWRVALEPPHKVKRAFPAPHVKSDASDSRQIAEYGYRFFDQLSFWKPLEPVLEQVKVLLSTRETFVEQMAAHQNIQMMLALKVVKTPLAETATQETIQHLKEQIRKIDQSIKNLVSKDPALKPRLSLLLSVPGVGILLASNLLVLTRGFNENPDPRRLASHIGICPHPYESGTSVYRRPRSRRYGPARIRKLLYLAAMSMRTHNPVFKAYFLRKVEAGKSKRLVLNNISNRMLRIICAVITSREPFIANYKSVNPRLLCA